MPQPQDASVIDFAAAKDVTPESAPVSRVLSGKERAGVNLTWGVLALIGIFLSVIILILWANESQNSSLAARVIEAGKDTATLQSVAEQRLRNDSGDSSDDIVIAQSIAACEAEMHHSGG